MTSRSERRCTIELSGEGLDVQYVPIEDVPVWHKNHAEATREAYERWQRTA